MQYFVIENGTQQGPFSPEELSVRGLTVDTLVWRQGMVKWEKASRLNDLLPYISQPPAIRQKGANGPGIAGLVLGIFSLVLCWVPIVGLVLAILGLIFSNKGLKIPRLRGLPIAGKICSIVGLVLGVACIIVYTVAFIVSLNY